MAKEGFAIFATSSSSKRTRSEVNGVGSNLWAKFFIDSPSEDEIMVIMRNKYPLLQHYIEQIFRVFVNAQERMKSVLGGRSLTIRDLIKWCDRIVEFHHHEEDSNKLTEIIFIEACDCFASLIPAQEARETFCRYLGSLIGLNGNRIDFHVEHYSPRMEVHKHVALFGRVKLPVNSLEQSLSMNFSTTDLSLRYMEKIAAAIQLNEPVLLVGETGTGKTTIVQTMAQMLGKSLNVINMSQQSDSTDLLGGFKPVDLLMIAAPLKATFDHLFAATFSVKQNTAFLDSILQAYKRKKWNKLAVGFANAIEMANKVQQAQKKLKSETVTATRKLAKMIDGSVFIQWENFAASVQNFKIQIQKEAGNFLFSFVEGILVNAIKNGGWILLDEINLANSETLECLSGLLQNSSGSLMLLERGDTETIKRHKDFRIFGCMNPATDAGKRRLPEGLRSRFSEFWIDSPDSKRQDLLLIIKNYTKSFVPEGALGDVIIGDVADFYIGAKSLSQNRLLFDGADSKVHISLRTLTRALSFAGQIASTYGIRRSLYEGCYMTFMTGLNGESYKKLSDLLNRTILSDVQNRTKFVKLIPSSIQGENFEAFKENNVLVDCFWIEKGPLPIPEGIESTFVLTPSVNENLCNLARACLSRSYPILIQGPTSAGKTSMIEYLAKLAGHRFIRINNHEHTDLQEYLGSYTTNDQGSLVFQEGILVEALRQGYWIVLDELNLAPSDVLEALNRLLDDNRELFIPEKQEIVKPHPNFMLFATQNPAGQYGGRKQLSRAFRNRFLELHVSDIPEEELGVIIERRCEIPLSYAKKLVSVYRKLCKSRDASKIFDGRHSFITLRDLFRWAMRKAVGYEELAGEGYMLLAERVRKSSDKAFIQEIIEKELKVKLDVKALYEKSFLEIKNAIIAKAVARGASDESFMESIVWTSQMKKLFVLVYRCQQFNEPVLLVGETGCGKTTVCQIIAELLGKRLRIVNAHQNSETADFLGSQRPSRMRSVAITSLSEMIAKYSDLKDIPEELDALEQLLKKLELKAGASGENLIEMNELVRQARTLFEWKDGPLIQAMNEGDLFLLDEISLADDSVLERLNSVLEPARQITLVEKGSKQVAVITAAPDFHFFATMNPGGDYGKKELSPALRNRFTEIWVPQVTDNEDLILILSKKMNSLGTCCTELAKAIILFLDWFSKQLKRPRESIISLRDILTWADFIVNSSLDPDTAFFHGGCMVFVDGIGVNPLFGMQSSSRKLALEAKKMLSSLVRMSPFDLEGSPYFRDESCFGITPFFIPIGKSEKRTVSFSLEAPTTKANCCRVLRAAQLKKPILLEGSPGAGKTSLITTLSSLSCNTLIRINLSEQTDLMDLFGSDLPVEGGSGGQFAWRDGPFLKAMKQGDWVLLDELNLASQAVLEGLNACFDHRAVVYIPELDKSFPCHSNFRVFAAQNPQSQGGGRKGLPKSFLNRFSLVYVDELSMIDLEVICSNLYPAVDPDMISKMLQFNELVKENIMVRKNFGLMGSPWEFNLRDVLRWLNLTASTPGSLYDHFITLYSQRMRTADDRKSIESLFQTIFGIDSLTKRVYFSISPRFVVIGNTTYTRATRRNRFITSVPADQLEILHSRLDIMESILKCANTKTLGLLVGPPTSGKSSLVRLVANLCGENLVEFSMNPGVDALEILGGFEQIDFCRSREKIIELIEIAINRKLRILLSNAQFQKMKAINDKWNDLKSSSHSGFISGTRETILKSIDPIFLPPITDELDKFECQLKGDSAGKFEWVDSVLIKALRYGYWLLIDNANLCSASVLDRLNSLMETDGVLHINERGLVDGKLLTITPHPNFRLFMTMDPQHGEISRAMRNRSVEIFLGNQIHRSRAELFRLMANISPPLDQLLEILNQERNSLPGPNFKLTIEKLKYGHIEILKTPRLPVIAHPGLWPNFVSGYMRIFNSLFADRLEDGSFLSAISDGTFSASYKIEILGAAGIDDLVISSAETLFKNQNESGKLYTNSVLKLMDYLWNRPNLGLFIESACKIDPSDLLKSTRTTVLNQIGFSELDNNLVFYD
jgi:midasin